MRLVLCAALALCVLGATATYVTSVPMLAWSGREHFVSSTKHHRSESHAELSDVDAFVRALAQGRSSTLAPRAEARPEAVLAFVVAELAPGASSAHSLRNVKQVLSDAESSLIVTSLAVHRSKVSAALPETLRRADGEAQVLQLALEETEGACDALMAEITRHSSIFANGKTDLVLISAASAAAANGCVERVSDQVTRLTRGNFVGLLSADVASPAVKLSFSARVAERSSADPAFVALSQSSTFSLSSSAAASNSTTAYTGPKYITTNILIGLIVAFSFIGMGLFGVGQVMAIKPPLRFATSKLVVGKEY